jgi:hypothetical protein
LTDTFAATFRRPFKEQVAAFQLRLGDLVPTVAGDDLKHNAHDRSCMVAGAMKAELLSDLANAVSKVISEGTGLEAFKRDFRAIVEKHGWHGWTGEGTPKGEAWRMRTIYRTNMRTSYMAGRLAQLRDGGFPFLVYRHGGSAEPRLHHLAWDGLILEAAHKWWLKHFPPNGWGCSCDVYGARSIAGAIRRGGDPSLKLPDDWDKIDPQTGTPAGISKGWDYAPGHTVSETIVQFRDKLESLNERPSTDLIQSWLRGGPFETWLKDPQGNFPLLRLKAAEAQAIGSKRLVAEISPETMARQLTAQPNLAAKDYLQAQAAVSEGTRRVLPEPGHALYLHEVEGRQFVLVKVTRGDAGLFVTELRRLTREEAIREGLL